MEYEHNGVTVINKGGNTSDLSIPINGTEDYGLIGDHMIIEEGEGSHEGINSNYINFRLDGNEIETERFDIRYI